MVSPIQRFYCTYNPQVLSDSVDSYLSEFADLEGIKMIIMIALSINESSMSIRFKGFKSYEISARFKEGYKAFKNVSQKFDKRIQIIMIIVLDHDENDSCIYGSCV